MIYFDNAATGGFKPRAVTDAVESVIRYLSANPGRSGHRLSITGAEIVFDARVSLAELFNAQPERVIFTKNCTEALNLAILGSVKKGMHVLTTVYEHNSVLRPLFSLKEKGIITLDVVMAEKIDLLPKAVEDKITDKTGMLVVNAVSNVTGDKLPVYELGEIAKKHNLIYIVDGAQAGGHIGLDIDTLSATAICLACHKGLYGIMGSGALILSKSAELEPIITGGTGSESFNLLQPTTYPDKLEGGTLNLPAISAICESARYVKTNMKSFSRLLLEHTALLIDGLKSLNLPVYSSPNEAGIVSFAVNGIPSVDVAEILDKDYDIAVRSGIHCAPLLHQFLGTVDSGLTRVSLSAQNTTREIRYFLSAIKDRFSKSF